MRIRFIKYTNTRIGGAFRTFQKGTVRVPGEELEVKEIVQGEKILENDDWYFDGTDNYYWSGGASEVSAASVNLIPSPTIAPPDPTDYTKYINERFDGQKLLGAIDYNFLLRLPGFLKLVKGSGVRVAILDHPIRENLPLKNPVVRFTPIIPPHNSHATMIAGLIAGAKDVLGVAPDVTIIELPMHDADGFVIRSDKLKELLHSLSEQPQPRIMNVSKRLEDPLIQPVQDHIGTLIIASAGKDEELLGELPFPARHPGAIAVGVVSREFFLSHPNPSFNSKLDYIFPDLNYISHSTNDKVFESNVGDSLATAIVSGLAALLISAGEIDNHFINIKEKLNGLAKEYSLENFNTLNPLIPPR